ncbi:siderophore-interacting protein [Salinibacterium sp. G-O1]|uniref:siderophore-interacting protein n=1 Tax=Salinibacterium sp. G-O1 TaxID=3046208 RepID=UPI0024B9EA58|nr:siderophore-interacting protein [Salinibacterium sp. G-O1]MDJ0336288.1 siderophore-interacting protein [Salinibacterium sp. G-O1]
MRPASKQVTLSVLRREQLSPHLVRIVAGGDGFDDVEPNDFSDRYVKIFFAPDGVPVTRTYTVRAVDPVARTLSIDFVVHGDYGIAGPWADRARPGDLITITTPGGGGYSPDPAADWHLFVGDQSALPAIAASLEVLASTAVGLAFIEVASPDEILELDAPAGVAVRWLVSGTGVVGASTALADAVAAAQWPDGRAEIFAHGERSAMKALRDLFRDRGITRDQLSLSGYWAFGRTEDRFQAEKREPIGVIAPVSE